jgi:hypothetical protein
VKKLTQAAVAAFILALSAGTIAHVTPAQAAGVSVQFDAGNVAFGYSDGYWDRSKAWHPWPNSKVRSSWQAQNRAHYTARRHDRSPGWGWRDSNQYWNHH